MDGRQDPVINDGAPWTGYTIFKEKHDYPQIYEHDGTGEVRQPRAVGYPADPTPEERAQHELTHMPFKSWCPICVRCKSKDDQHKQVYDKRPALQADYAFLTTREAEEQVTVITCIDILTGMATSSIIEKKGIDQYAKKELKRFIYETGRTQGILQTDNEPSIKRLRERYRLRQVSLYAVRQPIPHSRRVRLRGITRSLWGHVRTLREAMQVSYGIKIKLTDPIMTWIVKHASWLFNRYMIHSDGRKRATNDDGARPIDDPFVPSARRLPINGHDDRTRPRHLGSMASGSASAHRRRSILSARADGVVRARSIRRLPLSDRFDKVCYDQFKGVPWKPRGPGTESIPDFVVGPRPMPGPPREDEGGIDQGGTILWTCTQASTGSASYSTTSCRASRRTAAATTTYLRQAGHHATT